MNILSITAQKPHSTGSGTYLTELVRSFDSMGHKQAVVCGIYPDDSVSFPDGVSCYPVFFTDSASQRSSAASDALFAPCKVKSGALRALPFPITGMSDIMPYTSTRYRDLTPSMISQFEEAFIDAVSRAVSDLDPDLILCHHLFLLTALVRKHFPDRRICGISHGTDLRQMINCSELADIVRPHIAGLDMALALHADQAVRIKEIFSISEDRIRVIGSGYNDSLFNTDGRVPLEAGSPVRLCYAGKISRPKGVPEMLQALNRLAADPDVPAFRLTMAGGCQDEALRHVLDDLPPYIEWLGQIPQQALAELMKTSDIFILPSFFEGLPLVLIEAMASGAVPVSTDLPGVKDWIGANVSGSNVCYVPMPEMSSIDCPTDSGRLRFIEELQAAIKSAVISAASDQQHPLPDTSAITWHGVASRISSLMFF